MSVVNQWLRFSRRDLLAAQVMFQAKIFIGEVTVFLAQQSVEKALKGYLAVHRKRFGKTHDIDLLVDLIEKVDHDFAKRLRKLGVLTPYAVEIRYPELVKKKITKAKAKKAIQLAEWALQEIRSELSNLSFSEIVIKREVKSKKTVPHDKAWK